jgi:hypothetical protein
MRIPSCPYCGALIERAEIKRIEFDCPYCSSLVRMDFAPWEKHARLAVILGVTVLLTFRHGWDGGFVIFLAGFYGFLAVLLYFLFILPLIPVQLQKATSILRPSLIR